jgi:virulence-associated protein VagC
MRTRVFKSGNSQAVRIPSELAYAEGRGELSIARVGRLRSEEDHEPAGA